ncbi:MAG: PIN domain-containing protein [Fibrella sp.]|nr:PIN domain-containing protein [Armatimonadota bacterium]
MAFVLDTDTFSLAVRGDVAVIRRITEYEGLVFLSAVAFREALKGALATVADAEIPNPRYKSVTVADAYDLLIGLVTRATRFPILPYTNAAETLYRQLPKNILRVGPLDCRIAASAVASGMAVVTANTRHFTQIAGAMPELRFVDWRTP